MKTVLHIQYWNNVIIHILLEFVRISYSCIDRFIN